MIYKVILEIIMILVIIFYKASHRKDIALAVKKQKHGDFGMNYKISIVEDNAADAEYVTALVRRWAESAGHSITLSVCPSAEAFLFRYDEEQDFDILLLDIELNEINGLHQIQAPQNSLTGLELAKIIRQHDTAVQLVFITGFPDFIAEGYEVSALHYLMKPVSQKKLSAVLDKATANLSKTERRLAVAVDRGTEFIPFSRIFYIEAQKQYVLIHTAEETYRTKVSLAETEAGLNEFFFKCQRSFLVNLQHVTHIKNDRVVLRNGAEVPISRGMAKVIGKEIIRLF